MRYAHLALCLLGGVLLLDAIALLVTGKINLGTILPLVIGTILLAHGLYWDTIVQYLAGHPRLKLLWQLGWVGFGVWLVTFIIFLGFLKQAMSHADNTANSVTTPFLPKAIITLGSGFKDGKPTPTLAARLDKTAQLAKLHPDAMLVLTGGVGMAETQSEAEVMANYLQNEYALPAQLMLLEDKSTSTELNLKNSQSILQQKGIRMDEPIAIVTSDFHTLRAKAIAKRQGYQNIQTYGSITPLYLRYNVWLREYFAFVSGWLLREY